MENSSIVELLRDLSIIVIGVVVTVWSLILAIVVLVVYKRVSGAARAIRQTARGVQEKTKAALGFKLGFNLLTTLLRSIERRRTRSTTGNERASQDAEG